MSKKISYVTEDSEVKAFDFIPSAAVRRAITKEDREITDFEKATLVYNAQIPLHYKWDYLQLIAEETVDARLRKQIEQRLARDKFEVDAFKQSEEGFIYGVSEACYPKEVEEYFSNYDAAFEYAKSENDAFNIEKIAVCDLPERRKDYRQIEFDRFGEIIDISIYYPSQAAKYSIKRPGDLAHQQRHGFEQSDPRRFENHFINLPNPFKQGDVVRAAGIRRPYGNRVLPEWGIVVSPPEEWCDLIRLLEEVWKQYNDRGDEPISSGWGYFDAQIITEFLSSSNTFTHAHLNPVYLDYYVASDELPDAEIELMRASSKMAQGEASIDWFTHTLANFAKANPNLDDDCSDDCEEWGRNYLTDYGCMINKISK